MFNLLRSSGDKRHRQIVCLLPRRGDIKIPSSNHTSSGNYLKGSVTQWLTLADISQNRLGPVPIHTIACTFYKHVTNVSQHVLSSNCGELLGANFINSLRTNLYKLMFILIYLCCIEKGPYHSLPCPSPINL